MLKTLRSLRRGGQGEDGDDDNDDYLRRSKAGGINELYRLRKRLNDRPLEAVETQMAFASFVRARQNEGRVRRCVECVADRTAEVLIRDERHGTLPAENAWEIVCVCVCNCVHVCVCVCASLCLCCVRAPAEVEQSSLRQRLSHTEKLLYARKSRESFPVTNETNNIHRDPLDV